MKAGGSEVGVGGVGSGSEVGVGSGSEVGVGSGSEVGVGGVGSGSGVGVGSGSEVGVGGVGSGSGVGGVGRHVLDGWGSWWRGSRHAEFEAVVGAMKRTVSRATAICWILIVCLSATGVSQHTSSGWDAWWTYEGISGPEFWGQFHLEWSMCSKGRMQSPIDVQPANLLYDPQLQPLVIDPHRVHGWMSNTGHTLSFEVDNKTATSAGGSGAPPHVNITGGSLPYRYRLHSLHLHFGSDNSRGSEHLIQGRAFPAELQLLAWNSDLYANFSEASRRPRGLVAVALLAQVGRRPNEEFTILLQRLPEVKYKEERVRVEYVSFKELMPESDHYMTYPGSLTYPGCHETVTWFVINRPVYISDRQLSVLRQLHQGTIEHPRMPLENNIRPPQPLHNRRVLTNINFPAAVKGKACPSLEKKMFYEMNARWTKR